MAEGMWLNPGLWMQIPNEKAACNLMRGGYGIQAKQMVVLVMTTVVGCWALQHESGDSYGFEIMILVWGQDEDVEQIIR